MWKIYMVLGNCLVEEVFCCSNSQPMLWTEGRKDKVALPQGVTASNSVIKEKDVNDQRKVRWQKVASKTISRVEPATETRYKHLLSC